MAGVNRKLTESWQRGLRDITKRNVQFYRAWASGKMNLTRLADFAGVSRGTMARWVRDGQLVVAVRAVEGRRYNLDGGK